MTCGIYKIKNNVNGKMYIGQSVDIEGRWKRHTRASKTVDTHLYKSIRKHGLDNFTFSIICECPESALDEYEISYIKYYETINPSKGYNKQYGGANGRPTEETRKKLSDANKGNSHSDITKKKLSDANKGKSLSDITKKKMSDAQKNMTEETKQKMSAAKKKQYIYQGVLYNGKQELADFLGISYDVLANRIFKKAIGVTILSQSELHLPS